MEELLCHANNGGNGKFATNHPWETNAMSSVLRVPPEEQIFSGSTDGFGKQVLLEPEQRLVQCQTLCPRFAWKESWCWTPALVLY